AIYQNMYTIQDHNPHFVLILAGDHIYRMNYKAMMEVQAKNGADAIVACVPMPKDTSTNFGVVQMDERGQVMGFQEKPAEPKTIPGKPDQILASMGIYLFSKDSLLSELEQDAADRDSDHDFGKNIIPHMIKSGRKVFVYNFTDERGNPKYWRDIGTRDSYYEANMDLVNQKPALDIYDRSWPVRTHHPHFPPVRATSTTSGPCSVVDSMIGGGCVIEGARLERSILSPNVKVYDQAEVKESVIMEGVVIGARAKIRNAIIDKEVIVPPDTTIGYDQALDAKRFVLTTSGIVIVPKRTKIT
ncbi:MAG: sugar phosphate nucleotidyltransferase, partial [Sedimentisphaerales bacterium]|nr:sugar phosphate nucleotidyltransferase [Sedimentisphaerales bacterium]